MSLTVARHTIDAFVVTPRFCPVASAPPAQGTVQVSLVNGGIMTIDECDAAMCQFRWWQLDSRRTSYAYTRTGGRRIYAHELIAGRERMRGLGGRWHAVGVVDHVDGDGLNNRRCNLRICSHAQNMRNCAGRPGSRASTYKGVSRATGTNVGKWRATITLPGRRQIHIGYYRDQIEAARAYDRAAREQFGECVLELPRRGGIVPYLPAPLISSRACCRCFSCRSVVV